MERPRFVASLSIPTSGLERPTRYRVRLLSVASGEFSAAKPNEVTRQTSEQAHLDGSRHRLVQERQGFVESFHERQRSPEGGCRGWQLKTMPFLSTQCDTVFEQGDGLRRITAHCVDGAKTERGIRSAIRVISDSGNFDRLLAVRHRLGKSADLGQHGREPCARMN